MLASQDVKVQKVYPNSDGSKGTKIWDDLITILDSKNRTGAIKFEVSIHDEPEQVSVGNITLCTMGPSKYLIAKAVGNSDRKGRKIASNSISASFVVSYKSQPVIFLSGDIDQISLDEIVHASKNIIANTLVFPHYGGKTEGER